MVDSVPQAVTLHIFAIEKVLKRTLIFPCLLLLE
jgi:hypothetical protein